MQKQQVWRLLIICLLTGVALTACGGSVNDPSANTVLPPDSTVDSYMYELYSRLGGEEIVGPDISVMYTINGKYYQHTYGVVMVLDPHSNGTDRYSLKSVGHQLDIYELPRPPHADEKMTVDGYPLHPAFADLYDFLGFRFIGKALTNPIINQEKNQIEQYFENAAFYIKLTPGAEAQLLPYGTLDCDSSCRGDEIEEGILPTQQEIPEPFASAVKRLGIDTVGVKISNVYTGQDGYPEMVFSNMVLYYNTKEGRVYARPIAEILGFERALELKINSPDYVFYSINGKWGYNVKLFFQDFLNRHGGVDIAGTPISGSFMMGGVEWQCFTNMCLTYHPEQSESFQVQPVAFGSLYYGVTYDENSQTPIAPTMTPDSTASFVTTKSGLRFRALETNSIIELDEQQTLLIEAFQNDEPLVGAEMKITIRATGIDTLTITAPPTRKNGKISVTLPHLLTANDTLIYYTVCLGKICTEENYFLAWQSD